MNTKVVLSNARQIDQFVARWLRSKDEMEREDLMNQCLSIIKDTNLIITSGGAQTAEERNAVNIFRQAERYFNKSCK
jgi:GMP synthase-like glutamine amidotransferase